MIRFILLAFAVCLFPYTCLAQSDYTRSDSEWTSQEILSIIEEFIEVEALENTKNVTTSKCWCKDVGGSWYHETGLTTEHMCKHGGFGCHWGTNHP